MVCSFLIFSCSYSVVTPCFNTVPDAPPSEVTGHALSSTIILLTWLEPPDRHQNGLILYYEVQVVENETGILWTFFAVDNNINIASLHPYYTYVWTVAAHTIVGVGPFSTAISVQTYQAGLFIQYIETILSFICLCFS